MKAARKRNFILFGLALILSPGCTVVEEAADSAATVEPAQAPAAPPTTRFTPGREITAYKQQAAEQIVAASSKGFSGELPPMLKSVVILDLTLDKSGRATRVVVSRSNGFKDLERTAIDSVRKAKLPAPSAALLSNGQVRYLETWLFRDDGKFQIRSLVREPQPGAEKLVSAAPR